MKIIKTDGQFKTIQTWSNIFVPDGYAILPNDMDTTAFYQYNGCVDLTVANGIVTVMTPNVTAWEAWLATQPTQSDVLATHMRLTRNTLLQDSDWTQLSDVALASDDKTAWQVYRQALRDMTEQANFPDDVTWPVAPS